MWHMCRTMVALALVLLICMQVHGLIATDCSDPIKCWLESLVIPLPDFEADGFAFTGVKLYDMDVELIESSYESPTTSLQIHIADMTAAVSGHYESGKVHGKMKGSVSHASFGMVVFLNSTYVNNGKDQIPTGIDLPSCAFESIKVKVSLDLGLNHPIVDIALQNEIKKHFCVDLGEYLATNATNSIQHVIDPLLLQIMNSQPSDIPSSYFQEDFINWNDFFFGPFHDLLSQFVSSEFMSCFLERHPSLLSPYSASIFDAAMDYLTDGTGTVAYNFSESKYVSKDDLVLHLGPNVTMEIQTALLSGLDTYSNVDILLPTGSNSSSSSGTSLSVSLMLERLDMNFSSITYVNGPVKEGDGIYHYMESTLWTVSLHNVSIAYDVDVVVNGTFLTDAFVDQLLNPACLFESIYNVSLSSLTLGVDIGDVIMYEVAGQASTLEGNAVALMDNVYALLTHGFGDFTSGMIAGITQGAVRGKLNIILQRLLNKTRNSLGGCPAHKSHAGQTDLVVWGQSILTSVVNRLLNKNQHASRLVNMAVDCVSNNTGTLDNADMSVSVGGLNSLADLTMFQSVQGQDYALHSSFGIGKCDHALPSESQIACASPLSITIRPNAGVLGGNSPLQTLLRPHLHALWLGDTSNSYLEIEVSNLNASSVSVVKLNMDTLYDYTAKMLTEDGCIASALESVDMQTVTMEMDDAKVVIRKSDGSNATRDITDTFMHIMPSLLDTLPEYVNAYFSEQLALAKATCTNGGVAPAGVDDDSPVSEESLLGTSWEWQIALIATGSLISLILFVFHHRYLDHLKKQQMDAGESALRASTSGAGEDGVSWQVSSHAAPSIILDRRIPWFIRLLLPVSVCATTFVFIQSNMSSEPVSVWAFVTVEGRSLPELDVFSFNLSGTVQQMWDAKVYPLSILIAFFSGGWPYVKLMVMMAALVLPPSLLSGQTRGTLLKFVDAYGKWSLVDFFVMCMFLCAFYFDMRLGHVRGNPDIEVVLRVVPTFGFYGFLLATLISLGQGHLVLAMHRFVYDGEEQPPLHLLEGLENMAQHAFHVPLKEPLRGMLVAANGGTAVVASSNKRSRQYQQRHPSHQSSSLLESSALLAPLTGEDERGPLLALLEEPAVSVTLTRFGTVLLVFFYLFAFLAIFVGVYVHSFNFKFEGLTGLLLGQESEIGYSVVSISEKMVTDSGLDSDLSMRWMQASFVTVCIAMPLATIIAMAGLWVGPALSISLQKSLFLFAEVTNAWCALDVFCISLIAAILEIKQFAAFMVGDACDGLNVLLAEYLDPELQGDDKCFDVETTLTPSVSLLFLSMVIIFFFNNGSLWLAEKSLDERIERESRRYASLNDKNGQPVEDTSAASTFMAPKHATSSDVQPLPAPPATTINHTHSGTKSTAVQSEEKCEDSNSPQESSGSFLSRYGSAVKKCLEAVQTRAIVLLFRVQAIELSSTHRAREADAY